MCNLRMRLEFFSQSSYECAQALVSKILSKVYTKLYVLKCVDCYNVYTLCISLKIDISEVLAHMGVKVKMDSNDLSLQR